MNRFASSVRLLLLTIAFLILSTSTEQAFAQAAYLGGEGVLDVAWSPDGSRLATGDTDGMIIIWDQHGNRLTTLSGESDRIDRVAWSPDGLLLASGGSEPLIKIWDITSETVIQTLQGPGDAISTLTWSPTGDYFLVVGLIDFPNIYIWDATIWGEPIQTMSIGTIAQASWNPEGSQFAIAGTTLRIIDALTYQEVVTFERYSFQYVVDWNTDGTILMSADYDGDIRLWDMSTQQLLRTVASTGVEMWDARFSPDDTRIAAALTDGSMRVWDVETGQLIDRSDVDGVVTSVDWSPDGSQIAFGWTGNEGTVGDVQLVPAPEVVTSAPSQTIIDAPVHEIFTDVQINDIGWHPDGTAIVAATADGVHIYSDTLQLLTTLHTGESIYSAEWHPDGTHFALTLGDNIEIWRWDNTSYAVSLITTLRGASLQVAVEWSPDGVSLASIGVTFPTGYYPQGAGRIQFWDVATGTLRAQSISTYIVNVSRSTVNRIDWSPTNVNQLAGIGTGVQINGDLITFTSNVQAFVLDTNTGAEIQTIPVTGAFTYSVAWNPAGTHIAVGKEPVTVVYDVASPQTSNVFGNSSFDITVLDWHPTGNYLLANTDILDINAGSKIGAFETTSRATAVDWHPAGVFAVIGEFDGRIAIQDASLLPGFVPPES